MENRTNKKIVFWLVAVVACLLPFREILSYWLSDGIKFIPDLFIWFAATFIVVRNRFKMKFDLFDYAFLVLVAVGALSSFLGGQSLLAFALQTRSIGTMYVMFYLLRRVKLEEKDYEKLANILMIVSAVLIIGSFFEFFSDKLLFYPKPWADSILYPINFSRTYSLMKNPNTFGAYSFFVMFFVHSVTKKEEIWHKIYYGLVFLSVLLTASRSSFILIGLFLCFFAVQCVRRKKYVSILSMVLVFAISFGMLFAFNGTKSAIQTAIYQQEGEKSPSQNMSNTQDPSSSDEQQIQQKPSKPTGSFDGTQNQQSSFVRRIRELFSSKILQESSVDGRLFSILTGMIVWLDHPVLGTGFGTYGSAGSRMVPPTELYKQYGLFDGFYSDNEYITVLAETGLIGALVLLTCFVLLAHFYRKEPKKLFLLFCILLAGLFYNILELQVVCFVAYLFLSIPTEQKECKMNEGLTDSKKDV